MCRREVAGNYDLTEVDEDMKKVDLDRIDRIDRIVICTSSRTHVPIALEGTNFRKNHRGTGVPPWVSSLFNL